MSVVMNSSGGWIRSPQSLALLWATLAMSLVLGVSFVVLSDRAADALGAYGLGLTDDEAAAQVVESARQIVAAAHLKDATAGYTLCRARTRTSRHIKRPLHEFPAAPK